MTMRVCLFLLLGLACASLARRVQHISPEKHQSSSRSLKEFAKFLVASGPAAGFQVNGAGPGRSAIQTSHGLPARNSEIQMQDAEETKVTPKMSQALPFVECPEHLDGTYAGDVGFDPLNIGGIFNMKYLREAELKHGRVCMLATLGYVLVDLGLRAPGAPQTVSSLAAHDYTVNTGHMTFLLFGFVLPFELLSAGAIREMLDGETDREPGDFGFDPLGYKNSERYKSGFYSLAEIKNGRLAMLAFSGIVTASALYQKPFPYY